MLPYLGNDTVREVKRVNFTHKLLAFFKGDKNTPSRSNPANVTTKPQTKTELTLERLQEAFEDIHDATLQEITNDAAQITLFYIESLIDVDKMQSNIIGPLLLKPNARMEDTILANEIRGLETLEEAVESVLQGYVVLFDGARALAANTPNTLSRSIEQSGQEHIVYGPKDSLSELLEQNLTLVRRRLPTTSLKSRIYTVGSLSKTSIAVLYMDGITNPDILEIAFDKTSKADYDTILDSSHLRAYLEDHMHSVFPQLQQTDRPDVIAAALTSGKIVWLVANTPFALIGPITFFDLFQSPEDYIHRWMIGTFLRTLRFAAFFLTIVLTPLYVALTMHHYNSIPLEILYMLLESRSTVAFSPMWEATFMILTTEILKEASLRMPSKLGQTLGIVGGIVIGQAAVQAGFASNILIIHIAIAAIASFLVPNYLMTNSSKLIQLALLFLAAWIGMWGILFGIVCMAIHLNRLTSLQQPYLAPLIPFIWKDWKDTLFRLPITVMNERPAWLRPVQRNRKGENRRS